MRSELRVVVGDTWSPRLLPYFAMAMMGLMLITNVLNLKFVNIGGFSVIASQLVYVLALVLADVMTEVYGYRRVRRLLYTGLAFLVLYAVAVQTAVLLPAAHDYSGDDAFRTVFAQTPRIVGASIAAFFTTELTNSFIMSKLKVRTRARYFYMRATVSVGLAQVVNGVMFYGVAFAGELPLGSRVVGLHFQLACRNGLRACYSAADQEAFRLGEGRRGCGALRPAAGRCPRSTALTPVTPCSEM